MRLIPLLSYLGVLGTCIGLGVPRLSRADPTVWDRLLVLSIPVVVLIGVGYLACAGISWVTRWSGRA
jgi:hypothetical protein